MFFIYESRPNVTADAAAVAVASGNAIILRGGKEAAWSSGRIVASVRAALVETGLPEDCVQLVDLPDREAVGEFLALDDLIDIAIPRGGEGLRIARMAQVNVWQEASGSPVPGRSTEDAFEGVSVHVGEPEIQALVAVGEPLTSSENRCGSASGRAVLGTAIFLLETVI